MDRHRHGQAQAHRGNTNLNKVGGGRRLADAVEVAHVDELERVGKSGVLAGKLGPLENVRQVAEVLVPPVEERGQLRSHSPLGVQVNRRDLSALAREKGRGGGGGGGGKEESDA